MKQIIVINQNPIVITDEQAVKVAEAVSRGDKMIGVNGELISTSSISGIRTYYGQPITSSYVLSGANNSPAPELGDGQPKGDSKGYERFIEMRAKLRKKLRNNRI